MKSVKVHDDTHRALKRLKVKRRSRSIDQVIREMVRDYTGASVREEQAESPDRLTEYLDK